MPLAPTQTPSVTKVGGTFVYDDLAVTLLSTKSIPGDKIVQPRPGNVFIVAHLKFHNLSTAPVEINEWDFLVIAAGNDYDDYYRSEQTPPASYMAANQLGWDRLQPGDIIYRDLILQAPIGAHGARLNWWPDIVHLEPDAYGWFLGL